MKHDDVQMSLALDPPEETVPRQSHGDSESPALRPILVEIAEVPITGSEPQKYSATLVETGDCSRPTMLNLRHAHELR